MPNTPRPDQTDPPPLRLRADRAAATWWSVLGVLLVGLGGFYVVDTDGHPIALLALVLFGAVGGYFVVQLVRPQLLSIDLDGEGVHARTLWWRTEVPWGAVHLARVDVAMGEPYLELHVRERAPTGDPWQTRAIALLLPVGADVDALHAYLAARLGPPANPPDSVTQQTGA